ncbi:uncharacterized protein LODBEIA_P10120 [Lodderomyces beijingensis]|uniref:R3H domain-containing protein n=1 Tax=Lodderomyces beijingensis TaxID=1775926 RepID=A0ABP0ZF55_9ASCO
MAPSEQQTQEPDDPGGGVVRTFVRNGVEIEIQPYSEEDTNNFSAHGSHGPAHPKETHSDKAASGGKSKASSSLGAAASPPRDESLGATIITEIQQAEYICLVCTGEIDQDSKVWSCQECYRVYDLECIKDWAIRGSSTSKTNKAWKCPNCKFESKKLPSKFTCWCGKVRNPERNLLMPFSCGSLCNYKYLDCIHRCLEPCHPGKHPTCGATGPVMKCQCGKEKRQLPCLITPYKKGWKCESECNKVLCDLKHKCNKGCHSGACGKCQKKVDYKCYCGDTKLRGRCSKRVPIKCVGIDGKKSWIGGGSCGKRKKYYYDCGEHYKVLECQPPPDKLEVSKCKFSPDVITTCYCGKTEMSNGLNFEKRTRCTDPVPECDNICNKLLPCGCHCKFKCHAGECRCVSIFAITCACGHEQFSVPCKYAQSDQRPHCRHKCSALLSCRKHYHRKECCEFEQVALERERAKKKAIRNNLKTNVRDDIMSIEAAHICTQVCNRTKSCGVHQCQAMCHSGPCEVCLESTNDDLVCHCGKTVIPAPVRCGTELVCHEQCTRLKECGHPPERHECHSDNESCPKCTAFVMKPCDCGAKVDLPGIMCSQTRVSCGKMCQVPKKCGHPCLRTCSAKCTKEGVHAAPRDCQNMCQKVRLSCPHTCKLKCHLDKVGKSVNCDIVKCNENVTIGCACGNEKKKKQVKCGASVDNATAIGTILECDESCAAAKRDAQLRNAFGIDGAAAASSAIAALDESDSLYSDFVVETYAKQKKWCCNIENVVRTFIEDYNLQIENDIESPKRTHHFPAMTLPQRQYVHELCTAFGLYTESQDQEPRRSVFIVITRLTKLPSATVGDYLEMLELKKQEQSQVKELTQQEIDDALYNAIVIQDLFFGVTKEDIERELLQKEEMKDFVIQWIKESTFVLFNPANFKSMDADSEKQLSTLVSSFRTVLREKSLAFDCKMCLVDYSASYLLKIDRKSSRESSEPASSIAKKNQDKNTFNVLQNEEMSMQS